MSAQKFGKGHAAPVSYDSLHCNAGTNLHRPQSCSRRCRNRHFVSSCPPSEVPRGLTIIYFAKYTVAPTLRRSLLSVGFESLQPAYKHDYTREHVISVLTATFPGIFWRFTGRAAVLTKPSFSSVIVRYVRSFCVCFTTTRSCIS